MFIKPETSKNQVAPTINRSDNEPINSTIQEGDEKVGILNKEEASGDFFDNLSTVAKRVLGIGLSIFSGLMYGQSNTPVTYVRNNYSNASKNALDHIFSYYTGILCGSIIYLVIYCAVKRNKPVLFPQTILPGLSKHFLINSFRLFDFNIQNNMLTKKFLESCGEWQICVSFFR